MSAEYPTYSPAVTKYPHLGYDEPYVIVIHRPSRTSFILNRQYQLIEERNSVAGIPLGYEKVDHWDGWKPTSLGQVPERFQNYSSDEFLAIWVEKSGPTREAVEDRE